MLPYLIAGAIGFVVGKLLEEEEAPKYADGGSVLLAPNGKPSNLTPEQYKLVRTPEFKAWFGDWENDPANASKVVDENGEPLVCYHGNSNINFNVFVNGELSIRGKNAKGWYFTRYKNIAKNFSGTNGFVKEVFLKIMNFKIAKSYIEIGTINKEYVKNAVDSGYDGAYFMPDKKSLEIGWLELYNEEFVAFEPNQIKLADGSNTTFDADNPDIRFEEGGELYSEISKEINEVNVLSDKDLTPMQLRYLNKKLLFFPSDKMNTLREINKNLWQELRRKQMKVEDILKNKQTKKGVAGYLNEKYVYHFTTIFNLTKIVEDKSIGNWQELGHIISLTTNPIFGEVEVSGVKSWNQGMEIKKAILFSDLSVKIVFDLQKIKADGIKITKGSGKTGTHFGEYELIIPQFNEKDEWWKYVSWIEIDKNKKEIKEMLDYKWVKKRNIKDVMQLPIDIWIKGKQAESTLGVELKKLGIEVRDREKIDVEKYLFGDKKPKYADGGLIAPNGKPSNLTPEQYKLVRTDAFKNWFGDWENNPSNASKVVDENGEPLLLYRGNKGNVEELGYEFNLGQNFLNKKSNNNFGFFFTDDIKVAKSYGNPLWNFKYDTALYYVLNVFIDVKNIIDLRSLGFRTIGIDFIELLDKKNISFKGYENLKQEIIQYDRTYDTIDVKEWYTPNVYDFFDVFPKLKEVFINNKINGVVFKEKSRTSKGEITYAVFNSNQIKLADGTNTTFDGNNPDIRFEEGGKVDLSEYNRALKEVYPLIPQISHKIIHENNLPHNKETIIKLNEEIIEKVKRGDDKTLDLMWDIAWSLSLKHSINVITYYHKKYKNGGL